MVMVSAVEEEAVAGGIRQRQGEEVVVGAAGGR